MSKKFKQREEYHRIYSPNSSEIAEGFIPTYFSSPNFHGGEPYFCPVGWRRIAVDVGLNGNAFHEKYDDWIVAYHGTAHTNAMKILESGLRCSDYGAFHTTGVESALYVTPSIEYAGHSRYAKVFQHRDLFLQQVLQVRLNPALLSAKHGATCGKSTATQVIDPNFKDSELIWVVKKPPGTFIKADDGVVVYGLMLRASDKDPKDLPRNSWWKL